jgi:hypothetical protein
LRLLGQHDEAEIEARKAFEQFRQLHPGDRRLWQELTIVDFDEPIMFWSK